MTSPEVIWVILQSCLIGIRGLIENEFAIQVKAFNAHFEHLP